MHEYQLANIPVHLWENIDEFPEKMVRSKNKAYKIMSRELFVVQEEDTHTLKVDPKIVVFLGKQIFHLLGYRKKIKKGDFCSCTRRDRKLQAMS